MQMAVVHIFALGFGAFTMIFVLAVQPFLQKKLSAISVVVIGVSITLTIQILIRKFTPKQKLITILVIISALVAITTTFTTTSTATAIPFLHTIEYRKLHVPVGTFDNLIIQEEKIRQIHRNLEPDNYYHNALYDTIKFISAEKQRFYDFWFTGPNTSVITIGRRVIYVEKTLLIKFNQKTHRNISIRDRAFEIFGDQLTIDYNTGYMLVTGIESPFDLINFAAFLTSEYR